jgi:hypothetical protein
MEKDDCTRSMEEIREERFKQMVGVRQLAVSIRNFNGYYSSKAINGTMAVTFKKLTINEYITKLEDEDKNYIESYKEDFIIWVLQQSGCDLKATNKVDHSDLAEDMADVTIEQNYGNVATAAMGSEIESRKRKKDVKEEVMDDVIVSTVRDSGKKRRETFNVHVTKLDIVLDKPDFTKAKTIFGKMFRCVNGQGKLKVKGKSRWRQEHEKVTTYYCACGGEDDIYFQLRHNSVTDVDGISKKKLYTFKSFATPGMAKIVGDHFISVKNAEVSETVEKCIIVGEDNTKVKHRLKEHKEVICNTIILDSASEEENDKKLKDEFSMFQEACQVHHVPYGKPLPESEVNVERHETCEIRIIGNIEQNHMKDTSVAAKSGGNGQQRRLDFPGSVGAVDEVGKNVFTNLSLKGDVAAIPTSVGLDHITKELNNGSNPETVREDVVENVTQEEFIEVSRESVTESNEVTTVIMEGDTTKKAESVVDNRKDGSCVMLDHLKQCLTVQYELKETAITVPEATNVNVLAESRDVVVKQNEIEIRNGEDKGHLMVIAKDVSSVHTTEKEEKDIAKLKSLSSVAVRGEESAENVEFATNYIVEEERKEGKEEKEGYRNQTVGNADVAEKEGMNSTCEDDSSVEIVCVDKTQVVGEEDKMCNENYTAHIRNVTTTTNVCGTEYGEVDEIETSTVGRTEIMKAGTTNQIYRENRNRRDIVVKRTIQNQDEDIIVSKQERRNVVRTVHSETKRVTAEEKLSYIKNNMVSVNVMTTAVGYMEIGCRHALTEGMHRTSVASRNSSTILCCRCSRTIGEGDKACHNLTCGFNTPAQHVLCQICAYEFCLNLPTDDQSTEKDIIAYSPLWCPSCKEKGVFIKIVPFPGIEDTESIDWKVGEDMRSIIGDRIIEGTHQRSGFCNWIVDKKLMVAIQLTEANPSEKKPDYVQPRRRTNEELQLYDTYTRMTYDFVCYSCKEQFLNSECCTSRNCSLECLYKLCRCCFAEVALAKKTTKTRSGYVRGLIRCPLCKGTGSGWNPYAKRNWCIG